MTLSQLDYIVAVDTFRHFAKAAENCCVTQPTLSMQIQKLEDELGIRLFDRSKQPVVPTEAGEIVLAQAREVLRAARRIPEIVSESKNELQGDLKIGIIPTLAPYLLPYFISEFMAKYPAVAVQVQELVTDQITERLRKGLLDVGLVVTPLDEHGLTEIPLFREPFVVYAADSHPLLTKASVRADELPTDGLWLLTGGHCLRNQVISVCGSDRPADAVRSLQYETGSLETLIKLIDRQNGFTLLPYLATIDMDDVRRAKVRPFQSPAPVREVSLVIHRSFLKRRLIDALRTEITRHLPADLSMEARDGTVVTLV